MSYLNLSFIHISKILSYYTTLNIFISLVLALTIAQLIYRIYIRLEVKFNVEELLSRN